MLTRLALIAALAAPLPAFAQEDDQSDHLAEAGGLRLLHAWTRATDDDTAHVFVEIANTGDAARTLSGGSAAIAETTTLVGFLMEDGTGTYQPLPGLPVAPGTDLDLTPEGLALQLDGLDAALAEGDSFPMEVHFGETHIDVTVAVEAAGASQHSHAGHMH